METNYDDQAVEEVFMQLRAMVHGGQSVETALGWMSFVPQEVKEAARARYLQAREAVISIPDPGAVLRRQEGFDWYVPSESDNFFHALMERLRDNGMPRSALEEIDQSSTRIINDLRPPGEDSFNTRGLVLGHVQSGKTTSFMAVAAKAADVGYRFIIVLSGITNSLRKQTQERLERDLVGQGAQRNLWYVVTTADDDFRRERNAGTILGNPDHRILAVVKKNPTTLKNLLQWLRDAGQDAQACPILVIDDEADQASINIARNEHVSRINDQIRQILAFPKAAYVAYTATPFANLLIDASVKDDLYPRDFVRSLRPGEGYFGPEQLFGRALLDHEDGESSDGMDVIRSVSSAEADGVRPPRGTRPEQWEPDVPASLRAAFIWFLVATAARRVRRQASKHSSMLVHTSMNTGVQEMIAEELDRLLEGFRKRWSAEDDDLREAVRSLWEEETGRLPLEDPVAWEEIEGAIGDVLSLCTVVVDNYRSDRRLAYSEEEPAVMIAVGGNTLARGLTLEGLVVSYFVRASTTYDTLLQMGRWFGYRSGYSDLVRIWMTDELAGWFRDLALVEAEIRERIHDLAVEGKTPLQLPVAIRTHPAMSVTSAARMRSAVHASLSYSGQREQTILFEVDDVDLLRKNWQAAEDLVQAARHISSTTEDECPQGPAQILLRDVPAGLVRDFLESYDFYTGARRLRPEPLLKYIQEAGADLGKWDVFLMGRRTGPSASFAGQEITLITRTRLEPSEPGVADIKVLVGSHDRAIGLPPELMQRLTGATPLSDRRILEERDKIGANPMVGLYPIARTSTPPESDPVDDTGGRRRRRRPLDAVHDVMGVALFFPTSKRVSNAVSYVAAPVPEDELYQADYEAAWDEVTATEGA